MLMIIKGLRIRSRSGIGRIVRHLRNGDDNDAVMFLRGTAADIEDMHKDSVVRGATYAVRHWIVSPHQAMDRPQMRQVLDMLATEFKFEAKRAVVVEHRKKRSTQDAADVHWHVLVGEVDPVTGRVLKTAFDRIIHELVARASEYAFGHPFVPGKHTAAVIRGLRQRGMTCVAGHLEKAMIPITAIPAEAFTHSQHQEKKRLGLDLPTLRQIVKDAVDKSKCRDDLEHLMVDAGLEIRSGDKPGTWIVMTAADGDLVGALHRLAGKRKFEVSALMECKVPSLKSAQQDQSKHLGKSQSSIALEADRSINQVHQLPPERGFAEPPVAQFALHTIIDQLDALERQASQQLNVAYSPFRPTVAMKRLKEESRTANSKLTEARDRRWEVFGQLQSSPKVRWWCYFVGLVARRRKDIQKLEADLKAAEAEQKRLQTIAWAREAEFSREERHAKDQHAAMTRDVARKEKIAREELELIAIARSLIAENPEWIRQGLQTLMASAKMRLKNGTDEVSNLDMLKF